MTAGCYSKREWVMRTDTDAVNVMDMEEHHYSDLFFSPPKDTFQDIGDTLPPLSVNIDLVTTSKPVRPLPPIPISSSTFQDRGRANSLPTVFVPIKGEEEGAHQRGEIKRTKRIVSEPDVYQSKRKLSRKLPPKLTESLEFLALFPSPTKVVTKLPAFTVEGIGHSTARAIGSISSESTESPSNRDHHTPPASPSSSSRSISDNQQHIMSIPSNPRARIPPPSTSRKSFSHSTRPSTASSASTQLLTPASSIHQFAFRKSTDSHHPGQSCSIGGRPGSACGTTWSVMEEQDRNWGTKKKESRKERKHRKRAEKEAFDVDTPPSMRAVYEASLLDVIGEDGERVKFGDLVRRGRTIVIFIRHWFCPLCAQYMTSIIQQVKPEALEEADVELVIIGNGSSKMLPGYKNKAFKCPFKMYTDPTLSLYRALGLTRQTGDSGPDSEAGDYLTQTAMQSTLSTLKRATQMPLAYPGHFTQLGGEFIFDGTLNVSYVHRMTTTRSHAPIRDICEEAGVRLEWIHYEPGPAPPAIHRHSLVPSDLETLDESVEDDWEVRRDREIERIKRMKEDRRGMKRLGRERGEVRVVGEEEDDEIQRLEDLAADFGSVRIY